MDNKELADIARSQMEAAEKAAAEQAEQARKDAETAATIREQIIKEGLLAARAEALVHILGGTKGASHDESETDSLLTPTTTPLIPLGEIKDAVAGGPTHTFATVTTETGMKLEQRQRGFLRKSVKTVYVDDDRTRTFSVAFFGGERDGTGLTALAKLKIMGVAFHQERLNLDDGALVRSGYIAVESYAHQFRDMDAALTFVEQAVRDEFSGVSSDVRDRLGGSEA